MAACQYCYDPHDSAASQVEMNGRVYAALITIPCALSCASTLACPFTGSSQPEVRTNAAAFTLLLPPASSDYGASGPLEAALSHALAGSAVSCSQSLDLRNG